MEDAAKHIESIISLHKNKSTCLEELDDACKKMVSLTLCPNITPQMFALACDVLHLRFPDQYKSVARRYLEELLQNVPSPIISQCYHMVLCHEEYETSISSMFISRMLLPELLRRERIMPMDSNCLEPVTKSLNVGQACILSSVTLLIQKCLSESGKVNACIVLNKRQLRKQRCDDIAPYCSDGHIIRKFKGPVWLKDYFLRIQSQDYEHSEEVKKNPVLDVLMPSPLTQFKNIDAHDPMTWLACESSYDPSMLLRKSIVYNDMCKAILKEHERLVGVYTYQVNDVDDGVTCLFPSTQQKSAHHRYLKVSSNGAIYFGI